MAGDARRGKAVGELTRQLQPWRNVVFQIWNEHHDEQVLPLVQVIREIDPKRLVTSSPGFAGVLGPKELNEVLDFLTPHTSGGLCLALADGSNASMPDIGDMLRRGHHIRCFAGKATERGSAWKGRPEGSEPPDLDIIPTILTSTPPSSVVLNNLRQNIRTKSALS